MIEMAPGTAVSAVLQLTPLAAWGILQVTPLGWPAAVGLGFGGAVLGVAALAGTAYYGLFIPAYHLQRRRHPKLPPHSGFHRDGFLALFLLLLPAWAYIPLMGLGARVLWGWPGALAWPAAVIGGPVLALLGYYAALMLVNVPLLIWVGVTHLRAGRNGG